MNSQEIDNEIKTITWQKNPVIIENSDEYSDEDSDPEEDFRIIKYTDNKKYGVSAKNSFVYDLKKLKNYKKHLLGKYNRETKTITWKKNPVIIENSDQKSDDPKETFRSIKSDENSDEERVLLGKRTRSTPLELLFRELELTKKIKSDKDSDEDFDEDFDEESDEDYIE
jgi:hypothetical protein